MNYKNKPAALLPLVIFLYGCGDRTDRSLTPPPDAKWVTIAFSVPADITLLPMEVVYRSHQCKTVRYNSSSEPHDIPGYNNFEQPLSQQGNSNLWQTRIAIDGGGSCQWQLNSLRVSFKIMDDHPLVKGKETIATNYIFDFDDYGLSDGYGTGKAKDASGDLHIQYDFFPEIFINHLFKETSLELFGGETKHQKWSRRYRLRDTQKIMIEPVIHMNKVVTLESPNPPPGKIRATYPDGSSEDVRHIEPDYEKLLSLK